MSFTLGFRGVDAFSGKELGKDSPGRTSSMNKGPQHGSAALARKALNTLCSSVTWLPSHLPPFPPVPRNSKMWFRSEFRKQPGSKNHQSISDKSILETEILTWVKAVTDSLSPKGDCYCSV